MIINAILISDKLEQVVTSGWDGRVIKWSNNGDKLSCVELGNYINTLATVEDNEDTWVLFAAGKGGKIWKVSL